MLNSLSENNTNCMTVKDCVRVNVISDEIFDKMHIIIQLILYKSREHINNTGQGEQNS